MEMTRLLLSEDSGRGMAGRDDRAPVANAYWVQILLVQPVVTGWPA